mgnify:CR=1 FL=1
MLTWITNIVVLGYEPEAIIYVYICARYQRMYEDGGNM